jgi:hypothetical protein
MVDSGSKDEPEPRRFGSLDAALAALDELDEHYRRFAWVQDTDTGETFVRDGVRVSDEHA